MSTAHRPDAAQDFAGYLRAYYAEAAAGPGSPEEVWDRYHTPGGTHTVNGRPWDRDEIIKSVRQRREADSPTAVHVHEVLVEGGRAAARFTLHHTMLGKLETAAETALFAELAEDGRVASTTTFSASRPGWSGLGERPAEGDARPSAPAPASAPDPADYLNAYAEAAFRSEEPAGDVHDRFHTPDAVHHAGRRSLGRADIVQDMEKARRKGRTWPVEVHEALRDGDRFAARYSTWPDDGRQERKREELFVFGRFAADGRVCEVRLLREPAYGAQ
ncbi:nuclear transport factor 2 family protein [Streptomyces sp. DSM 42041]|uniref:Nuclear transport factor 2 family protein n=1 Tax=Streptomyces hazeniae TaxID=3075538 RepID=A0ABU2NM41_9ACTN|nr:nuclear transport factor 2 family protein [Streptomyces sp. DSM 42041]MDT0377542.1 nuclear transport factor 2 family protein [Streptomyces sp. DSM 42041]